jgi:hypothetical protein
MISSASFSAFRILYKLFIALHAPDIFLLTGSLISPLAGSPARTYDTGSAPGLYTVRITSTSGYLSINSL